MRIFDVFQHPDYGFEAVPRGFSWSAFLVPSLWATWRGLGSTTLALVVWSTLMFDLAKWSARWLDHPASLGLMLALLVVIFGILPGFRGHCWHAARLRKEQYTWRYTVVAPTRRRAIAAARRGRFSGRILLANGTA